MEDFETINWEADDDVAEVFAPETFEATFNQGEVGGPDTVRQTYRENMCHCKSKP